MSIKNFDKQNAELNEAGYGSNFEQSEEVEGELSQFPAFKKNPVMISGFL